MKRIVLIGCLALSGILPVACLPGTRPKPVAVRYIGHSSFYITTPGGLSIATDPFGENVPPLQFPEIEADIVVVSHGHGDHAAIGSIIDDFQFIFREQEPQRIGDDIVITGYETRHGEYQGRDMGWNWVYVFQIGAVKLVHLGDTGPITSDEVIQAISDADVMFVPAGTIATLSLEQVHALVSQTNARTVVPCHYSVDETQRFYDATTLEDFLDALPSGTAVVHVDELIVEPNMPQQIAVMSPWEFD